MGKTQLEICFDSNKLILTEGAVGQRLEHEFSLKPDADIMYSSLIYSAEGRDAIGGNLSELSAGSRGLQASHPAHDKYEAGQ